MDVTCASNRTLCFGSVTVEDLGAQFLPLKADPPKQIIVNRSRFTWRPAPVIQHELPPGFHLSLNCLTAEDGIRRFAPDTLGSFLVEASLGGHAILSRLKDLSEKERRRHHLTRLVFQQGPWLREHLNRTFQREQDF